MKTSWIIAGALSLIGATASAQVADRKTLTLSAVKKVVAAAEADAKTKNQTVVIAVVDDGGHLVDLTMIHHLVW